jgi:acyl-coenzyme A synthetase/AMP-(fatty) acid ligase
MNFPDNNPLGAMFLDATSRFHERLAIKTPTKEISYAELRATVIGLARNLQAQGVGPGAVVGVHINSRGIEIPFSTLALTLLGAQWIPYGEYLNGHPVIRLTHLLHDDAQRLPERFSMLITKVWPQGPGDVKTPDFPGYASADDTWFMPSSSGTTGARKVMAVSGRGFFDRISRLTEYPEDGEGFSVADLFPRDGSLSCLHFYHTLSIGGTYVFGQTYDYLTSQNVKVIVGSPRQLSDLLADSQPPEVPLLHEVRVVGGALLPGFLSRLLQYFRVAKTTYGSTEIGPISANPLTEPTNDIPLGARYSGITLEVVDENDHVVGPETEGIVRLKTPNQVSAYIGDSEASAEAFQDGWFYPGDRGRLAADGQFYVTGRVQDILNMSGTKFNAAQVDKALQAGNGVEDALCFIEVGADDVQNLAALIVIAAGSDRKQVIKDLVRLLLSKKFDSGLLPKNIYQVDEIPRNVNGKAMRHEAAPLAAGLKPAARVGQ